MKRGWKAAAVGFIALGLALTGGRASVGAAFCAYVLELTPFSTVTGAVGIDWYEPADAMLVSVNGPSGSPRNFSLVNPTTGAVSPFSALAGLPGEIKLATVKSGTCMGGFTFDQVFAGNGTPGQIMKMVTGGTTVTNPWVVLPGETGHIRGLYQDRHCAVGGDLVVVTSAGGIWRVTSAGVPTLVTRVARALEGVITLPNNPTIYGPLAGRILAGDEDRVGSPTFNGGNGRIFAVDPSGSTFTLGAPFGALVNYPLFSEFYGSTVSVNPEDFDIIPNQAILAAEFFGTSPSTNALLKSPPVIECACGSVVVSQEYVGDTGSSSNVLLWDPSLGSFTLEPTFDPNGDFITANFQHVAFRGVADCRACTGVIGDRIWKDLNGDGLQTPGEPGIAGVKVTLTKVGATGWSQSVFTDANGNYRFTGLCAGTYVVTVTAPSGDTFTTANVGSNRAIDSNVNGGQVILSADNSSDLTVDFGLKGPSVIGNFVWNDLNCNGIQDALEPGIAGVIVHLKAGLGNPGGADLTTTTTDANGAYQFLNLNPGDYTVVVDTPAGMNAAPALVGGVTVDSNGSPTNVTLTGGSPVDNSVDFGYCAPGGRIVVRKVTDPASDTTTMFTFNTTGTGYTGFTLTGGSSHDSGVLAAGTYGVTESPLAGWSQVGATCDNGNIPSAITLAAGQTVTCTFTNRKEATITVKKVMVGGTGSFAFTGSPAGTIAVNNGTLTQTVAAGTYTATEAAAPGWTLSSVVCDDTDSTGSTAGRAASFNVAAGENVTCTFTNTKDATITVKKVMVGGTGSFAFTGSPAGTIATNNGTLTQTVAAGTYTATEAAAPGWTLSSVVCDDTDSTGSTAGRNASFNVAAGENVTCTFTNTKDSTITVKKVMVGGTGSFAFTGSPSGTIAVNNGTLTQTVAAGTYTATEAAAPGWTLSSVVCDDTDSTGSTAGRNASFNVAAGENVTCTFTNTKDSTITVKKVMVGGTGSFAFTGSPAGTIATNNGTLTQTVAAGTYTATEAATAGWTLTSVVCDDSDSTSSLAGGTATFNVAAGENITCTFTNTKDSTITVKKVMVGGTGSFAFTGSPAGTIAVNNGTLTQTVAAGTYTATEAAAPGWTLSSVVCDDTDSTGSTAGRNASFNVAAGENVTCTFTNTKDSTITVKKVMVGGTGSFAFTGSPAGTIATNNGTLTQTVAAGTYTATEAAAPGWTLSSVVCDDTDSTGSSAGRAANFNVAAGENVTCTFTNTKDSTITVKKVMVGGTGSFAFTGSPAGTIATNNGTLTQTVAAGTYTATEAAAPGWTLSSVVCDDTDSTSNLAGGTATFNVASGENVTCTFTNTKAPQITVTKVVVNTGGGTKVVSDFPLKVDATTVTSGVQVTSTVGNHVVSETSDPNYTAVISGDCAANGAITLAAGDVKACTITNTFRAPKITVTKVVVNTGGGTKVISDFPLKVDATTVTSGVQVTSTTGNHVVSETSDPNYTAVISGDCAANGAITLAAGDVKACTITNTYKVPTGTPNLTITKTGNGSVKLGETATFTIAVTNVGPGTATGVVVTDTLPVGFIWADNQPACTIASGVMTCAIGSMAQGQVFTVVLSAPVTTTAVDCNCVKPEHHDGDHCEHESGSGGHHDGDDCEHEQSTDHHHSGDGDDHERRVNGHYSGDGCDHERQSHTPRHYAGDRCDHDKNINGHRSGDGCTHDRDSQRHKDGDNCDHERGRSGHRDGDGCTHEKDLHHHYAGDGDDHERGRYGHHAGDGCDHEKDSTAVPCLIKNIARVTATNENPTLLADNSSEARIGLAPTHRDGDDCDHEKGSHGHYDGDKCDHEKGTHHHYSGDGDDHERRVNGHAAGDGCDHERESHSSRHGIGDNCDHDKGINGHYRGDNCGHERDTKRHHKGDFCDHDKGVNGHRSGDGCQHEKEMHHHYSGDGDDHERGRFGHHNGDGCDHDKDTRNTFEGCACETPQHDDGDNCDHEQGRDGHHDGDSCDHEKGTGHHYRGDNDDHEARRNGHYSGDGCDHERQTHARRHFDGDDCSHERRASGHYRGDGCTHEGDLNQHHGGDRCDHDRRINGHRSGDGCRHEKDTEHHHRGDGDDHDSRRFGHYDGDNCHHDRENRPPTSEACVVPATGNSRLVSSSSAGADASDLTLTIARPASLQAGDVMIAAVVVRPSNATIAAPAGWTLVRRLSNSYGNSSALATYRKLATASEPASYTWTLNTSTGSAGGILAFRNVNSSNAASPVDVEAGVNTASSLSHTAPSVTTSAANEVVITVHSFASGASWAPPSGMAEAVDDSSWSVGGGSAGISFAMNYAVKASAGATGTKTATASNDPDTGNAQTIALRP